MAHTPFEPSFIVDIDGFHERKLEAVRCFASQFHREGSDEPPTGIAQPDFLDAAGGPRALLRRIDRTQLRRAVPGHARRADGRSGRALRSPFPQIYSARGWEGQAGGLRMRIADRVPSDAGRLGHRRDRARDRARAPRPPGPPGRDAPPLPAARGLGRRLPSDQRAFEYPLFPLPARRSLARQQAGRRSRRSTASTSSTRTTRSRTR